MDQGIWFLSDWYTRQQALLCIACDYCWILFLFSAFPPSVICIKWRVCSHLQPYLSLYLSNFWSLFGPMVAPNTVTCLSGLVSSCFYDNIFAVPIHVQWELVYHYIKCPKCCIAYSSSPLFWLQIMLRWNLSSTWFHLLKNTLIDDKYLIIYKVPEVAFLRDNFITNSEI